MKKTIGFLSMILLFAFATEKTYTFKFTESEAAQIIQAVSHADNLSAKQASDLITKIQQQAGDSTLNPKK